ncbi:MAG: FAD-dependent oxidoreductase [Rhodospirillaceae bacterium]|nr:FAD-dependent oxidoreductase [Rhodospirillaceae bacterium]
MSTTFPSLFSPLRVGPMECKNRIFSTGHMTWLLDGGVPSDDMVAYHQARAAGGASLIITEACAVHPSTGPMHTHGFSDDCIAGYRRIADAVKPHDCKVFGQLSHGGGHNYSTLDGTRPVAYAPSALPREWSHNMPRAMTHEDIDEVVACYGATASRMSQAGLDGIEIMASHNLLPAQFLNARTNHRTDQYGGSLKNRMRFLREVIANVWASVADGVVVGMRISGDEKQNDGLQPEDVLDICMALDEDGTLDYFNVAAGSMSGLSGLIHVVPPMNYEGGYVAPLAAVIKARVSKPVLVAGRINQPQIAEQIVASGQADMCGMTRAQIADPEMANKARDGRINDIRACIGCNQACIGHMINGFGISCIQRPETGRELRYGARVPAEQPRTVFVARGGPAGMKAACVAAERGHQVVLFERSGVLGGQVQLAQLLPGRSEFGGLITNFTREMELAGVDVRRNTELDRAMIENEAPDAVIIATGASVHRPPIEGGDEAHVVDAWQVLREEVNVGQSVVIADWRADWIGLGLAEKLASAGCRVRLAVNGTMAGQTIEAIVRDRWIGDLQKLGVEVIPYVRLFGVDSENVYLQHLINDEAIICEEVDTLVTALGQGSETALETDLRGWTGDVFLAGDCLNPRTAEEAVFEGLKAGFAV